MCPSPNRSAESDLIAFTENAAEVITREELLQKLKRGKPLRIKYGVDPSTADLHLGHTVALRKLRRLQDLGHKIIFLIGDFTARIGDPSQQSQTRPILNSHEVERNASTYLDQVYRILDRKPERIEIRRNSEWWNDKSFPLLTKLSEVYTLAQILERDDFSKRYRANQPISILEILYPLFQGYDSVELKADVEIGGTDQRFNLLVGRELQRQFGQEPQIVLMMPILPGTDGAQKMSKSLGNAIGIKESPTDLYGKLMSIPDHLIILYFRLLTDKPKSWIDQEEQSLKSGTRHPMELKLWLADDITKYYHGEDGAKEAKKHFETVYQKRQAPTNIPDLEIPERFLSRPEGVPIVELLKATGLCLSKSEARRLVGQGGVRLNQQKLTSPEAPVALRDGDLLQVGKHQFVRLRLPPPGLSARRAGGKINP